MQTEKGITIMTYDEAMNAARSGKWVTREAWYHPESYVRVTVDGLGYTFEEQDDYRKRYNASHLDVSATDWKITGDPR